jgi:hypothetical protein
VAKARVIVFAPDWLMSVARAVGEPGTVVAITLVFQFMLMLVSL